MYSCMYLERYIQSFNEIRDVFYWVADDSINCSMLKLAKRDASTKIYMTSGCFTILWNDIRTFISIPMIIIQIISHWFRIIDDSLNQRFRSINCLFFVSFRSVLPKYTKASNDGILWAHIFGLIKLGDASVFVRVFSFLYV